MSQNTSPHQSKHSFLAFVLVSVNEWELVCVPAARQGCQQAAAEQLVNPLLKGTLLLTLENLSAIRHCLEPQTL